MIGLIVCVLLGSEERERELSSQALKWFRESIIRIVFWPLRKNSPFPKVFVDKNFFEKSFSPGTLTISLHVRHVFALFRGNLPANPVRPCLLACHGVGCQEKPVCLKAQYILNGASKKHFTNDVDKSDCTLSFIRQGLAFKSSALYWRILTFFLPFCHHAKENKIRVTFPKTTTRIEWPLRNPIHEEEEDEDLPGNIWGREKNT